VRQQAADLFTAGVSAVEVAAQLEVSTKSAYAWRRAWKPAVEKVWSHLKRSLANL
jgi:transposase